MTEPTWLREQAERALRLAHDSTDTMLKKQLEAVAADYIAQADAFEGGDTDEAGKAVERNGVSERGESAGLSEGDTADVAAIFGGGGGVVGDLAGGFLEAVVGEEAGRRADEVGVVLVGEYGAAE